MAKFINKCAYRNNDLTWLQNTWGRPVQRLFWIANMPPQVSRGGHRHLTCQMAMHCVVGSVKVYVQTPCEDQFYTLDSSDQYLLLDPKEWRLMYEFSANAILVVLAEQPYELTSYIDEPYRPLTRRFESMLSQHSSRL